MIWPRRSVRAGDVEQGRKSGTAPLAHDCEPFDDKGAVEPDQRDHVGDGRKRHEIERGDQVRGLPPVPEARLPQRPVQGDEPHIDDPGGAQIAEPRKIVLAVGIDQRQRMRERLRSLVMIEHDHVKAEPVRELERLAADGSAIDRHDELGAFIGEIRYRLGAGAIALRHPIGDVDNRFAAAGVEIFAEERGAARAVDVVIAENGDTLAARDRLPQALGRRLHIAQAKRVRHQVAQARIEMALNRLGRDATPGEHAGNQLVLPADLRNGEGAQLPVRVEARPPRPPQRRALDVKEITFARQNPAFTPAAVQFANHPRRRRTRLPC